MPEPTGPLASALAWSQQEYDPNPELDNWIDSVMDAHSNLNFIQRLKEPDKYPRIHNPDGSYSTHKMSWTTVGEGRGTPIVYPNIVYDENTKTVKELDGRAAVEHALKTGEYIAFPSEPQASVFSSEYKRYWRPKWMATTPLASRFIGR